MLLSSLAAFSVVIADRGSKSNFCPVSSIINTKVDQINSYPLDIFDSQHLETIPQDLVFNCSSSDEDRTKRVHKCSPTASCPLTADHINSAQSRTQLLWNGTHSLCHLKESLDQPKDKIRVLVLGGSVTHGTATKGVVLSRY